MRATQTFGLAFFVAGFSILGACPSVLAQSTESQFISIASTTSPASPASPDSVNVDSLAADSVTSVGAKNVVTLSMAVTDRRVVDRPKVDQDDEDRLDSADQAGAVLGALMLCGGGQLPHTLMETFFELGQATHGSLVIIPSASIMADQDDLSWSTGPWRQFPWASIQVLHARSRDVVDNDMEFIQPLRQATAVWISGGDQSRLAERYLGTSVEKELKKVVRRGGVIGGTSAGSAIASRVMITGGRQQPVLGSGLDLLPGSIIDQHFSQRQRHTRLVSALRQHPDRVGIGIDESTGLVVSRQEARVVGAGSVYVYAPKEPDTDSFEPLKFESGSAFSLPQHVLRKK